MKDEQDLELVQQCLHGNQKAFEAIVDKYQKPVFNVALRILNNFYEAQDITQDVFIKAYNNLPKFNQKYKLFSWLYRIAINEALNLQSSHKRNEPLNEQIVSNLQTPEDVFNDKQTHQAVNEAINTLTRDYKTVVILKHLQGFSYTQIGEILGIPEKTVKSRLFTARQQLKDILVKQI
jgi:RNA polymerase sigma-70 factor (ECF subfamily)